MSRSRRVLRRPTFGRLALGLLVLAVLTGAGRSVWSEATEPPDHDDASARTQWPPTHAPSRPASSPASPGPTRNVWAGILPGDTSPTVARDPTYVYVPNGRPGTVEVIDPRTGRLRRIIHGVDHPYNLYFTPDGSSAIDVAEYENQLRFLDPRTMRVRKVVPMPCSGPDHLDFSAAGTDLLLGCEFDGTLVEVDWRRMRVVRTAHVGGLPVDVKLSPDGTTFYVANQGTGGVSLVDAATLRVVTFLKTGRGAHGMAVSRDTTKLYVTNRLAGTISVIDFARRTVVATWPVGGSPDMVQISPDGRELWESNRYGTTVTVVDTANGHVLKQIEVGPDPHGLAYFPQPGHFSLGHNGVYR